MPGRPPRKNIVHGNKKKSPDSTLSPAEKARQAILRKMATGQPLTPGELSMISGQHKPPEKDTLPPWVVERMTEEEITKNPNRIIPRWRDRKKQPGPK